MSRVKKYPEYAAVIDWLQWGDFPEKLGDINYPQVTLTMIAEMKKEIAELKEKLADCENSVCIENLEV